MYLDLSLGDIYTQFHSTECNMITFKWVHGKYSLLIGAVRGITHLYSPVDKQHCKGKHNKMDHLLVINLCYLVSYLIN